MSPVRPPFPGALWGAVGLALDGWVAGALGDRVGTSAVRAAYGLTMPYPYSGSRPGVPASRAVAVSRWMTSVADRFGYFDRISATTPATIAVASLVPLPLPVPFPWPVVSMSTPGA